MLANLSLRSAYVSEGTFSVVVASHNCTGLTSFTFFMKKTLYFEIVM